MPDPNNILQLAAGHHHNTVTSQSNDSMLDSLERSIESNPHLPHVPSYEPKDSRILSAVENHTVGYNPPGSVSPPIHDPKVTPIAAPTYNPFREKVFVDPAIADDRFRHGSFPSKNPGGYNWKEERIFWREPPVPRPRLGSAPKTRLSDSPWLVYCPKSKEYVHREKKCKKCPEYDPKLKLYDNCKLKKKEANKLSKPSKK